MALIDRRSDDTCGSFGAPVTRIRNVPVDGSIMLAWSPSTHCVLPLAGSSSIVYSAFEPATLRHLRGSVPVWGSFQRWLTGLSSVALGLATFVHFVQ